MTTNANYNEFTTGCVVNAINTLSGRHTVKDVTDVANVAYSSVMKIDLNAREVGHVLRKRLGYRLVKKRNGYTLIIK